MRRLRDFYRSFQFLFLAAFVVAAPGTLERVRAQEPGTVVAADKRVQGRSYVFQGTGETVPYALFVPSNYDASRAWPLMVGLHGANRPYDWLMGYDGIIDLAQRDGFIMVTPLGYHPLGFFGVPLPTGPPPNERLRATWESLKTLPPKVSELSERDVMNVLALVRKEFHVDPNRIYLWGHSMGGGGTLHLAAQHPDIWAAIAMAAPYNPPNFMPRLERFSKLPALVLQGDADDIVAPADTRQLVAKMKALWMNVTYVEVPGGDHSQFIASNRETLSRIFSFFSSAHKPQRASQQQ